MVFFLIAFGFGLVIWFVLPGLSGRAMNLVLVVGLVVLALFSGMFSVPEVARKVEIQATGELPGTLAQKEEIALTLSEKTDALREQILSSRDKGAILPMMDEFHKLKQRADSAQSEYEQDRLSPPPRMSPPQRF
jgi:hypothetical protein